MNRRSGEDRRKIHTMIDPDKERRSGKDRRILDQIRKLKIEKGDLLVFTIPNPRPKIVGIMKDITDYVEFHEAKVIFIHSSITVDQLDEETMNKLGWYRKEEDVYFDGDN